MADNDIVVDKDTFLLGLLVPFSVLIMACVIVLILLWILKWRLKISLREYREICSARKAARALQYEEGLKEGSGDVVDCQLKEEEVMYEYVPVPATRTRTVPSQSIEPEYASVGSTAVQFSMSLEMVANEAYLIHRREL